MRHRFRAPLATLVVVSAWFGAGCDRPPADASSSWVGTASERSSASIEARLAQLETELPELLQQAEVPGLALAVVREGQPPWIRAFGKRATDNDGDVDEQSIFGAASLTKPVFAYAVMKLVDRGELDLDRPLHEYFAYDDLAHDNRSRAITPRMVLSHSSGLPNWRRGRWSDNPSPLATEFEPGSAYQYSGEGMIYLQLALEAISGEPLETLVRREVFEPLGMSSSSFIWEERFEERYAKPHRSDGTPIENRRNQDPNAAGSMKTTITDYARFLSAVLDGEGLADGTLSQIITSQVEISEGLAWGLGWGLEEGAAGKAIWQWGHDPGGRAFTLSVPDGKLGMVFFSNSDNGMLLLRRIVEGSIGGSAHPALDHLNYESVDSPTRLVSRELERTILANGSTAARLRYEQLRREYPEEAFAESMLNRLGYQLLGAQRVDEAVAIFQLNVRAYPEASNPYDSLGEALMTRGDTAEAIANYERSLELDPDNTNAVAMLEKLRADQETSR